jgi:hypothetical protein
MKGTHQSVSSVRGKLGIGALVTLLAAINAPVAAAQEGVQNQAPGTFGLSAVQVRPVGALAGNIDFGYGIAGAFLLPLDESGMLSIRADAGVSLYGNDSRRTAFGETTGGQVEVDVHTSNILETGSVGMQLTLPSGSIRPYVHTGAGVLAFFTESGVESTHGGLAVATIVNQSDVAFAWTLGGGIYVPIRTGPANAMLDIGVQYLHGGNAKYLTPESIVDLPNGDITVEQMESSTHVVALRIGVRVGR